MGTKIYLSRQEKKSLRVSEHGVLRETFAPKKQEVAEDWRKIPNEKFHSLYFTKYYQDDQIKEDGMDRPMYRESERWGIYIKL
jgi:hypothetical protein